MKLITEEKTAKIVDKVLSAHGLSDDTPITAGLLRVILSEVVSEAINAIDEKQMYEAVNVELSRSLSLRGIRH